LVQFKKNRLEPDGGGLDPSAAGATQLIGARLKTILVAVAEEVVETAVVDVVDTGLEVVVTGA